MKQFFKFLFASCFGTILGLGLLFLILVGIGGAMVGSSEKAVVVSDESILKISVPDQLPEQSNNVILNNFSFDEKGTLGLHDMVYTIQQAANDPKIKGAVIYLNANSHGFSTQRTLRNAIQEFKKSNKFVYAYANNITQGNYYLASIADKIYSNPMGFIDLKGFSVAIPFYKELMDKIGLDFKIYYAGEFKSATEPFRLAKMSPENRLQISTFLNEVYDIYLDDVSSSRNMSKVELKDIIDNFKAHSPEKAFELKIVDSLSYEHDMLSNINYTIGKSGDEKIKYVTIDDYHASLNKKTDYGANKIAVLYAEGSIIDSKGREGEIGRNYLKHLREIEKDDKIKAVVLRINSGGGSGMMSDEILHQIDVLKASGKSVVVSMGDYAASGGYYIACHADSIFATPMTLTGSIGVFAMIPNVSDMLGNKIGIDYDTVGTGKFASKFEVFNAWKDEDPIIQGYVDNMYDKFLSVVSEGRKMSKEDVDKIARGRIWSGRDAKENGLIDRIGDLPDAINAAKSLASLDKYRIVEYPLQKEPIQKLIDKLQNKDKESSTMLRTALSEGLPEELKRGASEIEKIKQMTGLQMRMLYEMKY